MTEQTLLLIKPNATQHRHIGEIITIIEKHEFDIVKIKSFTFDLALADKFYEEHIGKDFFQRLVEFMTSGQTIALILEKENAVELLRDLVGVTNPATRRPGTIRYIYGETVTRNAVHASDSIDHAKREIALIFPSDNSC